MKIKTLIIVPLLIVGIAYIGAKGYIYYKAKAAMEKVIQLASPFVQIDYTDVGSKLDGTIYVDSLRLTPTGTYDETTIKRLSVTGNGVSFLLDVAKGFNNNQLPSQMAIKFEKLVVPVSSTLFPNLGDSLSRNSTKVKFEECSIPWILNASGINKIGISSISADGNFAYVFDRAASQAELKLEYDLTGIESTLIKIQLSQLSTHGMIGVGKLPITEKLSITRQYKPSYITQTTNHCATEASLSTASFIDDLFTQSDDYYIRTLGFVPGPGLSKLFKNLLTNAGTVKITATPSSELSPALLKAYRPEDLADLFGVTASYNSSQITDLSFSTKSTTVKNKQRQTSPNNKTAYEPPTPLPKKTDKTKPKAKLRYLDTEISDLKDYLHHKVHVYTQNSIKPKRGILTTITTKKIDVEQLVFGGRISSHIYIDTIERIEVLRKDIPEDK